MNNRIFAIGQRISSRANPLKKGLIVFAHKPQAGYQHYEVQWDNGDVQVMESHELSDEMVIRNAWDLLGTNSLADYRDFSISTTFHKVRNTTANTISSLKASRTIFKPYQYKPLVKILQSDLKRILVADEVGLGKTIEAGHIMLEFAARGNLRNTLIICTKSLIDKWKNELQDKFNFILKTYDSANELIQDIENDVAGSKKAVFGIINYEKCRNLKLQEAVAQNGYRFDLLICDEAHKIRNSETEQHKGVSTLVDCSDAVVFLTATPIMTDMRNLYNLIRVLDREGFDTYDIFNNAISQNRPFIKALARLNANHPLRQIAEDLHNASVVFEMTADGEVYSKQEFKIAAIHKDDELYQRARTNMISGRESVENRVKIQQDLVDLNSLNHMYTRTRKKDVMGESDVVTRNPKTIPVKLSDEEWQIYNSVIEEYDDPNSLGLIQRKRQMSSCIVAFRSRREDLLQGIYDASIPDAKFEAFRTIIEAVVSTSGKKIIVFAFFTNTLLYLKNKLSEIGINAEIIYGDIKDRTERIERFQHNENIRVLLSSEVGSEGLDLQFCDALVNYDLPWNPMVVEQRIGRIDRVGQVASVINIYNLIIKDTIEELIYSRLYDRINLFRESIGDLEEILGETEPLGDLVSKGIEALYKTKLTEEERILELERLGRAIENNRLTLENVKSQLEEAFANDVHFQNEIRAITQNNRYLTKQEIIKYLESVFRTELAALKLRHEGPEVSVIEIPANSKSTLFDFIEAFKDGATKNPELDNLYRKFKRNLGARSIQITFDQSYAYKHKTIEYMSAFHPLVNAITNFFEKRSLIQNQAYKLALKREFIAEKNVQLGFYLMAVYRITVEKNHGNGRVGEFNLLRSVIADLNGESVQILESDVSDHIYGVAQQHCEQFDSDLVLDQDFVQEVRPHIGMEIKRNEDTVREDERLKFLSSIKRRAEQESSYINSRIARINKMLVEGRGIGAILKNDIEALKQRQKQIIEDQKNATVSVGHSLVSVNLLQIV